MNDHPPDPPSLTFRARTRTSGGASWLNFRHTSGLLDATRSSFNRSRGTVDGMDKRITTVVRQQDSLCSACHWLNHPQRRAFQHHSVLNSEPSVAGKRTTFRQIAMRVKRTHMRVSSRNVHVSQPGASSARTFNIHQPAFCHNAPLRR